MSLAGDLREIVRGEVDDSVAVLNKNSRDASLFRVVPKVVVRPAHATDICALVDYVTAEKKKEEDLSTGRPHGSKSGLSLTARAAGTDMSGGPLNDSIVVDMTAHLKKKKERGVGGAVVERGMYFRDFAKETKKKDLQLPSYAAS